MSSRLLFTAGASLILLTLGIAYGFQYEFTGDSRHAWFSINSAMFLSGVGLLWMFIAKTDYNRIIDSRVVVQSAGPTLSLCSLSLSIFFSSTTPIASVIIAGLSVCFAFTWLRWDSVAAVRLLFFVATILGAIYIAITPLNPQAADMLPIIQAASEFFLSGQPPYGVIFPGSSVFPFVYLPGTWLPYLPFVALDLDPRLLNLAGFVALALMAEHTVKKFGGHEPDLTVSVYPMLLSPVFAQALVYGQAWPYWLMTAGLAYLLLSKRLFWAAFVLGLMLATRQWAVFIAWPVAVYYAVRLPFRQFSALGVTAAAGFLLLIGPMSIFDSNLIQVAFLDVVGSASVALDHERTTAQVSLIALLKSLGIPTIPTLLLITLSIIVAIIIYKGRQSAAWLIFVIGLSYIGFVTCNFQVFRYYYVPGWWLVVVSYPLLASNLYRSATESTKGAGSSS